MRVTFDQYNNAVRVLQEDEYYAFGLRKSDYDYSNNNRHLYNGKELQVDLANQYDYGARFYDPVIARWTTVDPHVEKYESISPFSYGFDNPIRNIDIEGRDPGDIVILFGGASFSGSSQRSTSSGKITPTVDQIVGNIIPNGATVATVNSNFNLDLDEGTQGAYDLILANYKSDPKGRVVYMAIVMAGHYQCI